MFRAIGLRAAACAAVLSLVSCSEAPQTEADAQRQAVLDYASQAKEAGLDDQYKVLADGEVSQSEYETQVDVALSCNRDRGRGTYEPWINPVDGITILYDFLPGQGVTVSESESGQDCETLHSAAVQAAYIATHEPVMQDALRAYVAECAPAYSVTLSGTERSLADFVRSAGDARKDGVLTCVDNGLRKLHPDDPIYFVTY